MKISSRIKTILGIGVTLALVAGGGVYWAQSSVASSLRYVTAVAATGDVTQTYTATGSVTRKNTSEASFEVDGTVKSVSVSVGSTVHAGDTLAVLNKAELQLAVLDATTAVAEAQATLYSARHPSSSSSSSGSSSGSTGLTVDPTILVAATSRVNLAVLDEAAKCDAIVASVTATSSGTGSTSTGSTSAGSSSASSSSEDSSSESTAETSDSDTTEATASATPTATASQLGKVTAADFTDDDLTACTDARAEVLAANANLQDLITTLTSSTSKKKKSTTSTTKVSKSAVAKAKAALLEAEQDLASAEEDLGKATLVAPISGTVGTVDLTVGSSSSGGSITIVGSGNAILTFELPLKTRKQVDVGQSVSVTPAGSSTTLSGEITSISTLETSGTSGDTATYTATALIEDPDALLPSGAKAAVTIPVKSVTGVLRLPASAVTPTGTGAATVEVVTSTSASTATSTQVSTGAVGSGWVEITSGLEAGAIVVLADNTAEIPSNQTNQRRTTSSSSSSSSASASAAAQAGSGEATTQASAPAAEPSATATSR